jgi:hypothetical protein
MKPMECEFEAEVLAATLQSRWPEQVEGSLRAHVRECAACSDVVAIASAMEEARDDRRATGSIPDASRVWWHAQLRARREAAKTAGRPITAAQVMALACAAGLLGAFFGATSTWFQTLVGNLVASAASFRIPAETMITEYGVWFAAAGGLLLLIPAAVYLAILRD